MVENVIYQGGNRLFIAKDGLHLPKLPLTFLNYFWVSIVCHQIIFRIDQTQGRFIQLQLDNPAFIVHRSGGAVLHGLCHVIDVNIIAEDFSGASVFCGYGRPRKADIGSVWETVADNTGCTNLDFPRRGIYFLF